MKKNNEIKNTLEVRNVNSERENCAPNCSTYKKQ